MYLSHYNLVEKPFQITTDPRFLWLGEKHQQALAMLRHGALHSKGLVLLTGDVGTGKTTLINALLRDLDSNIIVATVADPNLQPLEFFSFLATALKIEAEFTKEVDFLTNFTNFLNSAYADHKKVLLIIDEAQKLSTELIEEIRMLSEIEKENTKLLNILFVGQNELVETLKESKALTQGIAITHQIDTLTEGETAEYIKYRLKVAGTEKEIFNTKAICEIYAFSRGYPRLINIVCDHALLTAYVRHLKAINPAIIKECAQELTIPGETGPGHLQARLPTGKQERKPLRRAALYACLLSIIAFCGYLVSRGVKHEAGQSSLADNVKGQESVHDINRPQAYRANVATLERGRAGEVVSKEDMTDSARRSAPTPTLLPPVKGEGLSRVTPPSPSKGKALSGGDDVKLIISFGHNDSELQQRVFDTLDRLAAVMVENPDMEIVVKGHTDTTGPPPYNKSLSELRANSVKSYLMTKGINPSRIYTIGMGEEGPLKPNTSWAGRRANRRVEIEFQP
jgi:general secretion pathway protein A